MTVVLASLDNPTRRRILDAAAALFRERGYNGTGLRDIAAAVQMKAGSLYYHFASKDEIVVEVLNLGVQRVFDEVRRAVDALPPGTGWDRVLLQAITAHLRALHEIGDYTSANVRIYGQLPAAVQAGHAAVRARYEDYWADLLGRCAAAGAARGGLDPRLARTFLLSAMNASLEWFDPARGSVDGAARAIADIVLYGMLDERKGG
jgi:AcrR family transcriptional regulator